MYRHTITLTLILSTALSSTAWAVQPTSQNGYGNSSMASSGSRHRPNTRPRGWQTYTYQEQATSRTPVEKLNKTPKKVRFAGDNINKGSKKVHFGKPNSTRYFYKNRPAKQLFNKKPSTRSLASKHRPNTRPRALQKYSQHSLKPRHVAGSTPKTKISGRAPKPRNLASRSRLPSSRTPKAPKGKFYLKSRTVGGAALGLAAGGAVLGSLNHQQNLDQQRRSGNISQAQYNRQVAGNVATTAGELYKLKKFNPTTAASNMLIGTDPLSLGVNVVGDIFNGTDNAKKSLENVGKTLEGHVHGVKTLVTDPGKWADKAGKDIGKAAGDVVKGVGGAVQDAGKFIGGLFGKK